MGENLIRYEITLINEAGCTLYVESYMAKDENEAMVKFLHDVVISSGDKIIIEEV